MTEGARVYPLQHTQPPEPLWREVLGRRLRALRTERWETLAETAERAGISPQYLSEVERGLKEPSSEMIAALAGALGTTLADLVTGVADEFRVLQVVGGRFSRLDRARGLNRGAGPVSGPVALALAV
ncbi:MAG: helix-turn-helix domain-containing protein [Streptosporangiales bacterium]|nr:helix-turn-helix domain-containing protein [Streptosporangiales bacterium]